MKKLSIIGVLSMTLVAGFTTTSCEDMLTVDTGDKSYVNANDTLYSYLGIMRCMQDVAERQVMLGELRGDLVSPTEYATDTLHAIANFDNPANGSCSMLEIRDYYNVINNCNLYIANADTNLVKSNKKYMLPEYRQVQAIRAWAYLQLVKNYDKVPFITKPIASLDVIKNFDIDNPENIVDKTNLIDKFLAIGLDKYAELDNETPSYGSWENGAVNIPSRLCFIPSRILLGDMYLLRGQDESDYKNAAKYYYEYLKANSATVTQQYLMATKYPISTTGYLYTGYASGGEGWGRWASSYVYNPLRDLISLIPGSSNKQFGTLLTRVANIYGYDTTSSQNSDVSTDDNGNESVSTSGAISATKNYKRQFAPSNAYKGLNDEQTYVHYNNGIRSEYDCGDIRLRFATENVIYEGESYDLCAKAANGSDFYYTIPIYRKTLVWLRLAEAINRAGFPQFAFAILKDGLNRANIPVMDTRIVRELIVDDEGNPILDEEGKRQYNTWSERYVNYNSNGAMYYADSLEVKAFFLDFNDTFWNQNFGIHARGCGYGTWRSEEAGGTVTNLTGYNDSISYTMKTLLAAQNVDIETADKNAIINAVENIIVDELALETSFEGNRFTDLVRIADHKTAAGLNGAEWLANKVASRDMRKDKEDPNKVIGNRDESLYNKLLNKENWYFTKPAWEVR